MTDPTDRRALRAIVLCLAVFYVWSYFFAPRAPETAEGAGADSVPSQPDGTPGQPAPLAVLPIPAAVPATGPCVPESVPLSSDTVAMSASTCGGALTAIDMRGYQEAIVVTPWWTWIWQTISGDRPGGWTAYGPQEGVLGLLGDHGRFALAGRGAPGDDGAAYEVVQREPLTLRHVGADGLTITKTFVPGAGPDIFDVTVQFSSATPLSGPFWVGLSDRFTDSAGAYDLATHMVAVVDGGLEQLTSPLEVVAPQPLEGPVSWFGIEDRYFLSALVPADPGWGALTWAPVGDARGAFWVGGPASLAPDQPIDLKFTLYAGPKYVERLSELGHDLDEAANLGIFGFFAKILLFGMTVYEKGMGNWGLAILALTFTVRLVFFPLSAKAFRSGKAMQAVQPLLKELQEKYKDDKEALNRETMALFGREKVNPLGGCLPMLVQMPIFFAMYSGIAASPDLFQARFLFIHDLSAPDPYGALPFLMAVGSVVQQRMTPMTGMDPAQQQMMRFMPLIFALFMLGVPAGLSLYYALNTVLAIAQQWYNTRGPVPVSMSKA